MSETHLPRPQPLDMDNAYAYQTLSTRVPGIVRDIQVHNPDYPPAIMAALDRLIDGLSGNHPIPMIDKLPVPPLDFDDWAANYAAHAKAHDPLTWLHTPWFFAETFLYRHVMQAVRWLETGRDPFLVPKRAELQGERLWDLLKTALAVNGPFEEKLPTLIGLALWGNRVDLSHPAGTLVADAVADDDLLADDRESLVRYMTATMNSAPRGTVHIIADNTGSELAIDFVLADFFLNDGRCCDVALHVKWHPTFVSDATVEDVWHMLTAMERYGGRPAALADRMRRAWQEGRFKIAAHPFWNSGRFLFEMPTTLRQAFSTARLAILKGDMNYRRAAGDGIWPPEVSFSAAMDYFPAPLLALRSLKCDVLVGVPAARTAHLDASGVAWRPTGQYGVIQFAQNGD